MYGELRNFDTSFDTNQHLTQAASGSANRVTQATFERDLGVASAYFDHREMPTNAIDSTPIRGRGSRPLADASGAGFNASKGAYIESNQGGYQARSHSALEVPPSRSGFMSSATKKSVRMADYRHNFLRSVTRGLRALT